MHIPRRSLFYDFHTSPNYPDVGKYFNAEEFTDFLKDCGIDFLTFHARCNMGMAYYDTKIGTRHPSLKFDLFGSLAEACARKGIALNAYFNGGLSQAEAVQHPDWESVPSQPFSGEVSPLARRMCYNSPYHEHLTAMVEEVVSNYPVAGVFIDCVQANPCRCERCSADMKAVGLDPNNVEHMTEFSQQAVLRMADNITAAVKRHIADPLIYFNCIDYEDQKNSGTYLECECIPSRSDWGYEYLPVIARYMRTLHGKHCLNMTARFYSWGDFGGLRTETALKYELLFGLANGLRPNIGDHFHPNGSLNNAVKERVKSVYNTLAAHETYFDGATPFTEAAVVYPKSLAAIRTDGELRGVVRLLSELDIQFDIVTTASDWSAYKLLILPDNIILDNEILRRLEQHHANGGKIISSGHSGLNSQNKFPNFWPVEYLSAAPWYPLFFSFPCILPDMPFALHGKGIIFDTKKESQSYGTLHKAYHNMEWFNSYPEFYLPPENDNVGTFLAANEQIAHISHEIFGSYYLYAMSELRSVLAFTLKLVFPEQKLKIKGRPSFLRSVINTKENSDIIHLFAVVPEQKGTMTQIIEDEITVTDLTFSVDSEKRNIKKVVTPTGEIPFAMEGHRVVFKVESMHGCLPITIEYC